LPRAIKVLVTPLPTCYYLFINCNWFADYNSNINYNYYNNINILYTMPG